MTGPPGASRNTEPLTQEDIRRVADVFNYLDWEMKNVKHEPGGRTVFRVVPADDSDDGIEFGEIAFGPDIYPGRAIANPNAMLEMRAAAAHELAHYHRWLNKTAIGEPDREHLDEAMTSLEAIVRYAGKLSDQEKGQLAGDALVRLALYNATLDAPAAGGDDGPPGDDAEALD